MAIATFLRLVARSLEETALAEELLADPRARRELRRDPEAALRAFRALEARRREREAARGEWWVDWSAVVSGAPLHRSSRRHPSGL